MEAVDSITLRRPDDFHVHVRQGQLLRDVMPYTAGVFGRLLIMPNTQPPIEDAVNALRYQGEILQALPAPIQRYAKPLMTIYLTPTTTPEMIAAAATAGVIAAKLYPVGVTTGSANGVRTLAGLSEVFQTMRDYGMVLCVHAETPQADVDEFEREALYIETLAKILLGCSDLHMVVEHVSSAAMVRFVRLMSANIAATITAHHLALTRDDLLHAGLRPHLYCKPVLKSVADRTALREVLKTRNPKFFFGSDSAPHPVVKKESSTCAAGIYSAPVRMPLLIQLFEQHIGLERLEDFTSRFGAQFYGLPLNGDTVTFERKPWKVAERWPGDIVPLCAGETLAWRIAKEDDNGSSSPAQ